jgi:3-deoxy-D-manno-octulosonic-acid transferase
MTLAGTEGTGEAAGTAALQKTGIPVVLGDTMGELRKFYALATVVFVGRTLVDLGPKQHGSDMIEPCALAKPSVVGPFTGNFEEPMRAFRKADAIVEVDDAEELLATLEGWLRDPESAKAIGRRAREVVIAGKGAVQRHVDVLLPLLG